MDDIDTVGNPLGIIAEVVATLEVDSDSLELVVAGSLDEEGFRAAVQGFLDGEGGEEGDVDTELSNRRILIDEAIKSGNILGESSDGKFKFIFTSAVDSNPDNTVRILNPETEAPTELSISVDPEILSNYYALIIEITNEKGGIWAQNINTDEAEQFSLDSDTQINLLVYPQGERPSDLVSKIGLDDPAANCNLIFDPENNKLTLVVSNSLQFIESENQNSSFILSTLNLLNILVGMPNEYLQSMANSNADRNISHIPIPTRNTPEIQELIQSLFNDDKIAITIQLSKQSE